MQLNHRQQAPPQGQISIQDIISIYATLATIPNRSESLAKILGDLETVISTFSASLTMPGVN